MGNEGRRYNPAVHGDSHLFVTSAIGVREGSIAIDTVLSAAFTPLALEAYRKLITDRPDGDLILPDALPGKDPVKYPNLAEFFTRFSGLETQPFNRNSYYYKSSGFVDSSGRRDSSLDIDIGVGAFGDEFALASVDTYRALFALVPAQIGQLAEKAYKEHGYVIDNFTFFKSPIETYMDSIRSISHAFSFLSNGSEKPGFETDPVGLFRVFIENGTFRKLARNLTLGSLGECVDTLKSYPLDIIDPETLTIRREFISKLGSHLKSGREYKTDYRYSRQMGCPVAHQNTPGIDANGSPIVIPEDGVTLTARLYVEYLDHFYKKRLATSQEFIPLERTIANEK